MGDVIDMRVPMWWLRFDWSKELGVTDPWQRAALIATQFYEADEIDKYTECFDGILSDMLRLENRLN